MVIFFSANKMLTVRTWAIWIGVILLLLMGCTKTTTHDPYFFLNPRLPVVLPIKLDRSGSAYAMEFWVVPEHERAPWYAIFANDPSEKEIWVRNFFLGFRAVLPAEAETSEINRVEGVLASGELPLEVKLTKIDTSTNTKVQLYRWQDSSTVGAPGDFVPLKDEVVTQRQITNGDTVKLQNKGLENPTKRYVELQVATLRGEIPPGRYLYEIKVLKDNPAAANIQIEMMASNYQRAK